MKEKSCCFTGHRSLSLCQLSMIEKELKKVTEDLIKKGITDFYCGGAIGFDTLAAETVLSLKSCYPHIKLLVVIPCKDQVRYWSEENRKKYINILSLADQIIVLSEYYYRGCMQKRNRYLVDKTNYCVCYLTKDRGGTFYTVNYARKRLLTIINISDCLHTNEML